MKLGIIDSVILYSQYTSSIYHQLVAESKMEEMARNIKYYCLSSRIAQFMEKKGCKKCIVPNNPNQDSLISSIIKN